MRKTVFTVVLIIFSVIYSISNDKNYMDFYRFINKAELYIVEGDIENANKIYNEAFEIWTNVPSVDYYNALLCAVELNKHKEAFILIEKLAKNGWTLEFFEKNPYLNELRKKKQWENFIDKYPKLYNIYIESLDTVLMKVLNNMLERDQFLVNSNNYSEYLQTVIYNANKINAVIKNSKTDRIRFGSNYSVLYSPFPNVLLRHYCGIYNEVQKGLSDVSSILSDTIQLINLEKSLLLEIKKGHLSPLVYDMVTTYSGDINKYGNGMFFKVGNSTLKKNFSQKEIEQINAHRDSIGLSSIDDYIKKLKFINEMKDENLKPFYFKFRISDVIYQMKGNEKKLKQFIENRLDEGWQIVSH